MVKGRRGRGAASAPGSRLDVRSLSVKVIRVFQRFVIYFG
jgi:hypothetical protein